MIRYAVSFVVSGLYLRLMQRLVYLGGATSSHAFSAVNLVVIWTIYSKGFGAQRPEDGREISVLL